MEALSRWAWAFGLAGLLALVGGLSTAWVLNSVEGRPSTMLIAAAVLLVSYAVLDREQVGHAVQSREFVYGSGSAILVMLMTVAMGGLYVLAERNDQTWDLTESKTFTLSDHSRSVVASLDEPVTAYAFFRKGTRELRDFRVLIDQMQSETDQLTVRWVDPLREPRMAEEFDVTSDTGTLVLTTADGRKQRLDSDLSETAVIKRLVLLIAREEHRICWALGHGEPDPDDEFSDVGLGVAVVELEGMNYRVARQVIPTTGIDPTCDALVIARPESDWEAWEREALAAYLGAGGRVFALFEPLGVPELAAEMERFGIRLREDVVLDVNPQNQWMGVDDPSYVVLHGRNLLSHPITSSLAAAVILPVARSVEALTEADGLTAQEVMRTSVDAWGETDFSMDADSIPAPDPGSELVGEVPVMAVSVIDDPAVLDVAPRDDDVGRAVPEDWAPVAGGRLAVLGDSDFASNGVLARGDNRDLFLNTIAWLVEEEDQIGERPGDGDSLDVTEVGSGLLCLLSTVFVPGLTLVFVAGILLRRRYL